MDLSNRSIALWFHVQFGHYFQKLGFPAHFMVTVNDIYGKMVEAVLQILPEQLFPLKLFTYKYILFSPKRS